ncbi:helix-turn-helix domain-containing protein [Microbacterium sp. NIBRBAC000506063]|uniref:helix-turn-helix domain-containing protein n=1 Tax=Microbacterium sp. NIBRBAC000506063 TaxID=2734618 RepID=UPI001BB4F604|nr:AraC family transcriptional regulator [Microbacterium sp. NIBRBAC000506063]QTV80899.1 helix-turn-helix transcriptional regulator [Microbacterium sp. NIBRBAC000506063]
MAPLIAVESTRSLPTNRVAFAEAKIIHVMEGNVEVETTDGATLLAPGTSLAIGAEHWCRMRPRPHARMWTVYADEGFLRTQMGLLLPDRNRVLRGLHPEEWDGRPLLFAPGISRLQLLEPLWRQMSVLRDEAPVPEVVRARAVELFARWMSIVAPTFLAPEFAESLGQPAESALRPIRGRLTDTMTLGHVGRAVRLLRERMHEPWTVAALAESVALSRAQLTRLFAAHTGLPPIRFLTEVRLTEFVRLIEETELSVAHAAQMVGWPDPRIASAWFSRRFGLTPSQYRRNPHPHLSSRDSRDQCAVTKDSGQRMRGLGM